MARTAKLAGCSESQVKRVWAEHQRSEGSMRVGENAT
ncbi:hypothetical protein [Rhizobium mongolense]